VNKIFNLFNSKTKNDNETIVKNQSLNLVKNAVGEATLYLYDDIGFYGVEAQDIANALQTLNGQPLTVRISSNGGLVSDGLAIYSMLKDYPGKVTTINDSVAASIATVIYMAGEDRKASSFSSFMTHKPMAPFYGNSDQIQEHAELLQHFNEVLINAYVSGGLEREKAEELIASGDNWFMSKDAVEMGFSTEEIDVPAVNAKVDLSAFEKIPENVLNSLNNLQNVEYDVNVQNINDEKPIQEVNKVDYTQEQHDQAVAEAVKNARKEAITEVNNRITAVKSLESYIGREELAATLLSNESVTVEEIEAALKAAPIVKPGLNVEDLRDDAEGIVDIVEEENLELNKVENFAKNIGKKVK